jgi:phytoene dehydrogenase-like protein
MRYDAIIIGGGHNGLVTAACLAKAGKKVLVLEKRSVLGGAACTEEIVPGFKFSVFSYVVSLLRPEIIRDLDLPRHGLEILPLDGTFTPMPSGDYLWRVNDHGKTRREIERHSKVDAEAYDEFGKSMVQMCRFVKPILGMVPPDPTTLDPRDLKKMLFLGRRFQALPYEDMYNLVQLMTMSAADFLDQWFETDVLKATMSASGIIGTFSGDSLAGHRVRFAASLHGRNRRRVPFVGIQPRRHRRDFRCHWSGGARGGSGDSHRGIGRADHD